MISVVVPTFNRSHRLARLVSALEAQVDAPPFELIVVDDASTDDTWDTLQSLAATTRIDLRPVRLESNTGPATARNAGWRVARGWAVAFTDDDCVPDPAWLAAMWRQAQACDLVQGRTIPDPEQREHYSWFCRTIEVDHERGFYETCNMAYRRTVLEELGGFDPEFRYPFGEDVDLAWRAKAIGASTTFAPEALVLHDIHPGRLIDRLRALRRQESLALAVRRHPGLRARLDHPWFYQPSHPRALTLLAGLVALAFRPLSLIRCAFAVLLAIPWVAYRVSMISGPEKTRLLARLLILDIAETASFARASLRYRTFLL